MAAKDGSCGPGTAGGGGAGAVGTTGVAAGGVARDAAAANIGARGGGGCADEPAWGAGGAGVVTIGVACWAGAASVHAASWFQGLWQVLKLPPSVVRMTSNQIAPAGMTSSAACSEGVSSAVISMMSPLARPACVESAVASAASAGRPGASRNVSVVSLNR